MTLDQFPCSFETDEVFFPLNMKMANSIVNFLSMMFFTLALSANATVLKDVATITRTRCYANCLTEVRKSSNPNRSCPRGGNLCEECIKPCQIPFTTIQNCRSNCKNSKMCLKSCDFLLALKTKGNVLEGKDTISDKPGVPVEVTKNVTSITLSWKPANSSEGSVVYVLKERITGDFNVRSSDFSNLVFFQAKAVLSVKQVCMFAPRFRFRFSGIKFYFTAVALTENSSIVESPESLAIEMTRPNPVVHIANPNFRYNPRPFGDKLRLTTTVEPSSAQEHLITQYGMTWMSAFCQPFAPSRSVTSSAKKSRNITIHIFEKLKACEHTLKVYALIECIPSLPTSLKYRYRGCRFVDNFNKTFCHSFDPPPTPDNARAVRNLTHSPLKITDDFRVNTTFFWAPPTFPFGQVTRYRVSYGDVNRLFLGRFWLPTISITKTTSLSVTHLLPNITVRVLVIPYFPNAVGIQRNITFRTPVVPKDKINIKNVQFSKFTFSPAQLFSVHVTWQRPVLTKGLLGYNIAVLRNNNRQKSKAFINATSTSYLLTRISHSEALTIEIEPTYAYQWITPNIVKLNLKAPVPDVQDVIVRNLQLNSYTFNNGTFTVKFTWNAPTFTIYKTVGHYEIAFHLVGPHAHHVHCPSFGNRQSCPAAVTNLTSYLIPKVAPWQYTIITVKPVFKNSFVEGFSKAISIEPLEFTCQDKRPGFYEDPLDCTAYYQCGHHGLINHFHCQTGLYWNSTILACDWTRNGNCKHQNVLFSCEDKANGYYPDPESCQSFYQCYGYHAYWESCPGELYWNQNTTKCDWPNNVDCDDDKLH